MHRKTTIQIVVLCDKKNSALKTIRSIKRNRLFKITYKELPQHPKSYHYLVTKQPQIILYDPFLQNARDIEVFVDSCSQLSDVFVLPFIKDIAALEEAEASRHFSQRLIAANKNPNELASELEQGMKKNKRVEGRARPNPQLIATADQTPMMIWECDVNGKFIFFNQAWLGFRGKSFRSEMRGGRVADMHPDDREAYSKAFSSAVENRHCYKVEYRIKRRDDQYAWLLESASPHYSLSGEFMGLIGTAVDITEKVIAEATAHDWKKCYQAAVQASGQILMDWDPMTRMIQFSGDCESFFGDDLSAIPNTLSRWIENIRSDQQAFFMESMRRARFESRLFHIEYDIKLGGKISKSIEHSAQAITDKSGNVLRVVGFITDVTAKKKNLRELRQREARYRTLVSNIPGAVYRYSRRKGSRWTVDFISREIQSITGYPRSYFLRNEVDAFTRMVLFDDRANRENMITKAMQNKKSFVVNYRIREKNGEIRYLSEQGRFSIDPHDQSLWLDGVVFDVTERAKTEEKLNYIASHDPLTGLPNRMLMVDRLSQAVKKANRSREKIAVMYLDLDHFKRINDTLGHQVGDKLLQMIAGRLKHVLYDLDTVTRIGGDEFVVIAIGLKEVRHALKIADKIFSSFKTPFFIEGHELFMTCSIGIAVYPDDANDKEGLLKNADVAMHRAKQCGRNSYQLYSPTMNDKALVRMKIENGLRKAIEAEELRIHYQPFIDVRTGEITGMEALLRWHHAELGMVSPDDFIPVAEETGLIIQIGEWVIRKACSQIHEWQMMGVGMVPVSINLSSYQFRRKEFVSRVSEIIHDTNIDPKWIEFELTESTIMENVDEVIDTLNQFRSWGIQVSVDDFGTGYSSLSRLKRFPINKLKIDRAFIRDIPNDPDDTAIAEAIISMAKNLSLSVVAEGVETEAQRDFLQTKGCDIMQGFLFSRPVSSLEFTHLLTDKIRY